jgi:gliding motility-associated-like protein
MRKFLLSTAAFVAGFLFSTNAANSNSWTATYGTNREFIENKGQFNLRHSSLSNKDIKYAVEEPGKMIYFTTEGVIYHFYNLEKNKNRKKGDKTKPRYVSTHDFTSFDWVGANPDVKIVATEKQQTHHSYALKADKANPNASIDQCAAFKKITYKNLYPNVDVEYIIHPENGIKYSVILHPHADPSLVKMHYASDKNVVLAQNGKLQVTTLFGDITENAPVTFYEGNNRSSIASQFQVVNNTVSFVVGNYNKNKTVVIDPWVQTPNFNTQWKCVWECDKDASGNAFLIGGVMPLQLLKYSNTGTLLWTYNTPYDTANTWLGALAVDDAGSAYVTEGTGGGLVKVNPTGTLVYNNPNTVGGLSTEFWTITFNCDQTRLVIGGAGGAIPPIPYIYQVNMTNGNVTNSLQVTGGELFPTQEVRAIAPAGNGKYYFLTHDSIGYINQNFSICANPTNSKTYFPNSYSFGYKCENFRVNNTGICALRTYNGFAYVNRGNRLDKRDLSTLAIVASVAIPGGNFASSQVQNSGIDIDDCGNIFVGSRNQVVKFDPNLNQLATYVTSFNVYDVQISTAGDIIAAGSTGSSSGGARTGSIQQIAGAACATIPIICCDATMCKVPPLCVTASAVTITVSTPGGTFSGPGVNPTTGSFNPATAGVGTHNIVYTLPCGADSIKIVVNSCTPISVCKENNGNLTVSGGSPVFTWSYWRTAQVTPITNQAECTSCGGTWIPFVNTCTSGSTCNSPAQWVNFGTGATVTPPPSSDSIRVVDNAGTTLVVRVSTVAPCSPCPTITVAVQTKQDVTCASATSGSATFTASGGAGTYTYVWSPSTGSSTATATNMSAGTYSVTATDANGCTGTGSVTINPAVTPTLSFSNQTNPSCGQSNGSVSVTLGGGTAPYVVTIDNGQGSPQTQNVPIAGTAPVSNLAAVTYTITVRDANNCTVSQTLTLTPPNAPTINTPVVAAEVCAGQNNGTLTSATATGGTGTLQWNYAPASNPGSTTSIAAFPVTNLAPGNYILNVRDANNCTDTINFTIAAGPNCCNLSLAIATVQPNCGQSTGSITVTPSPSVNYTYAWSNSLPAQATQNNLAAGQYNVTVSETGNPSCNKDTVVNLNNSNGPTLTFSNKVEPSCNTANGSVSVTLAGGSAPYTVTVDNGQGAPQTQVIPIAGTAPLTGLAAGNYTISVVDASTCSATQTITFTEPSPPVITSINATAESCLGDNDGTASVTVIGGTGTLTFLWSNGEVTPAISGLTPNTYSVTITDAGNCSVAGNVVVSAGPVCCTWNISAALTQPSCGVNDGSIDLTVLPVANNTYAWSNSATGANNPNLGAGAYSVTITNTGNNCVKDTTFNLSNSNAPTVSNAVSTPETCTGGDGTASITASGGTGTLTITWSNSGSGSAISNLTAGTYSYTVTDANNCQATGSVTVAPATGCCNLQVTATATDASCAGNDGAIQSVVVTAGSPPYQYSIDGVNYQVSASFTSVSAGSYVVYVQDAGSCVDTAHVTVGVANNSLTLSLTVVQPGCVGANGGSITANAAGGNGNITYAWSNAATSSSISNISGGNYSVTVTDAAGCTLTDAATLTAAQPLTVSVGNDVSFCQGESATIAAPSGYASYLWSDGAVTATTTATASGVYSVTVTDGNGCTASDALLVTVFATPVIGLPTDTTVYENNPVVLNPVVTNGSTLATYLWQPYSDLSCNDCANPVANPTDTITYTLAYTSANNCTSNAQITINVLKGALIYMPNVFSPNGDGNNDVLFPLGVGMKSIQWKVFNRWGELIFVTDNINIGWDGNYQGMAQPPGVYVYTMQVTFMNKTARNYKGSFTLIK